MKIHPSSAAIACVFVACAAETPAIQFDESMPSNPAMSRPANRGADEEIEASKKRYAELQGKLATTRGSLDETAAANVSLKEQADASAQVVNEMKQQLEAVSRERDQLAQQVISLQSSVAELSKRKEIAESTVASIASKLRPMREAGQLSITMRDGRMVLGLSTDILFDSARTAIKKEGRAALAKVAQALQLVKRRKLLIAGHTDNQPIRTAQFPSNWELSTRRAVEVVRYLISQHMAPGDLAAAGYGEFEPIVDNDTKEHRAQNRRIEIILLPDLVELPSIDDIAAPQWTP